MDGSETDDSAHSGAHIFFGALHRRPVAFLKCPLHAAHFAFKAVRLDGNIFRWYVEDAGVGLDLPFETP